MHRQSFRRRSKLQLCSCMLRPGVAKTWKKSGLKILGFFEFCDVNLSPPASKYFPFILALGAPPGVATIVPRKDFDVARKLPTKKTKLSFFVFLTKNLPPDYPPASKYFPFILALGGPQGLPQLFPERVLMWLESCPRTNKIVVFCVSDEQFAAR